MAFFQKKIGPVFIKENSDAEKFIEKMSELKTRASGKLLEDIETQINLAKYGAIGENNVAYELKNSGMDMYILRDVYLEKNELSAQIDYLVITRKHLYIIECKNLIGNIEIDNTGAFLRTYELFGKKVREGIYSPITQNERHLHVLKEIRRESKGNLLFKMLYDRYSDDTHKSIVVLANPKTYLNAKYAKKEIKNQVIRADQLIDYIKTKDAESKDFSWNNEDMLELAVFYLKQNREERSDYSKKYQALLNEYEKIQQTEMEIEIPCETKENVTEKDNREDCVKALKKFRLEQSRKEGIKPYFIFNDAQMNDLLNKKPKSKDELQDVSGFGTVKIEKYGNIILHILQQNKII